MRFRALEKGSGIPAVVRGFPFQFMAWKPRRNVLFLLDIY